MSPGTEERLRKGLSMLKYSEHVNNGQEKTNTPGPRAMSTNLGKHSNTIRSRHFRAINDKILNMFDHTDCADSGIKIDIEAEISSSAHLQKMKARSMERKRPR
jgi:hypothetical protein